MLLRICFAAADGVARFGLGRFLALALALIVQLFALGDGELAFARDRFTEAFDKAQDALDILTSLPGLRDAKSIDSLIALLERLHAGRAFDAVGAVLDQARGLR